MVGKSLKNRGQTFAKIKIMQTIANLYTICNTQHCNSYLSVV